MTLAIGDLQGCSEPLQRLLSTCDDGREPIWFCGDLVNRGPDSLGTLRAVMALGDRARSVLGNHDLHLLAVATGARSATKRGDTMQDILDAPDRDELVDWLRHRPLAIHDAGHLMVHAGVVPPWDLAMTLELAHEVEKALRSRHWVDFLRTMYGNKPNQWRDDLTGDDRRRAIVNVLTRVRYLRPDGSLDFDSKLGPEATPGLVPWFDAPGRRTADTTIVFGHWSTLGLVQRPNLIALDTGCVWGGCLSAMRLETRELWQVRCPGDAAVGGD